MLSSDDRNDAINAADRALEEYGNGSVEHLAAEAELENINDAYAAQLADEPDWDEE